MSDMKMSVIVPVYNAEDYIEACLDSILSTPMEELEVIAVDDGSSDRSPEILDRYAGERVRVIHQKNAGASRARNAGLDAASGEYVGFVDSDDWVEPSMFRKMYDSAVENDADIVFCNLYRNKDEKMRRYLQDGLYDRDGIAVEIFPLLIANPNEHSGRTVLRGAAWCRIFRRSLIEERRIRFDPELIYNEDGLFCIEATLAAERYLYLGSDYLYHNRWVPGSLTKRYIPGLWKKQRRMESLLQAAVKDIPYDFSAEIAKKVFDIAVYCAENECKTDSPLTKAEQNAALREIMEDELLRGTWKEIAFFRLKKINMAYAAAFRLRMPAAVRRIAAKRKRMQSR